MPFVPLSPDDRKKLEPCRHPQHDPPSFVVIHEACRWVCPACRRGVVLYPRNGGCGSGFRPVGGYSTKG